MRSGTFLIACGVVLLVAACSSGSAAPAPPAAPAASQPALNNAPAQTSTAIPALAPLVIGPFPHTTDGRLARDACRQWAKLRTRYVSAVVNLSPYQLNQWFSGHDWARERSDWEEIGGDPVYNNLGSVFGTATIGDMADDAVARQVDKGCEKGVSAAA